MNSAFIYSFIIGLVGAALFLFVDKYERDGMVANLQVFGASCRRRSNPAQIAAVRHWVVLAPRRRRRLLQFLPFNLAEPNIQRLPCGHQIRPHLNADELHAGSLVRVHKASIILVADVGPEIIQNRFHDLGLGWTKEGLRCAASKIILSIRIIVLCVSTGTAAVRDANSRRTPTGFGATKSVAALCSAAA
jgi:hypothetical protein